MVSSLYTPNDIRLIHAYLCLAQEAIFQVPPDLYDAVKYLTMARAMHDVGKRLGQPVGQFISGISALEREIEIASSSPNLKF